MKDLKLLNITAAVCTALALTACGPQSGGGEQRF